VSDLFLGIIALAVLVMAVIQVAAVVFAARAARRVSDAVTRLEQGVQPIVANLQQVSADAARASASAASQVERAGRLLEDVTTRLDTTVASFQENIVGPARDAFAFLQGLKSILATLRGEGDATRARGAAGDEEDALFIG
jgi:hypothetical protein